MKSSVFYIALFLSIIFSSCNENPTLQEYYVESQSRDDFVILDIPSAVFLGVDPRLDETTKEKLRSIEKANILAFPKNEKTDSIFKNEKKKVENILENEDYKLLMEFSHSDNRVKVMYVGETRSIDEMIFYGDSEDFGFAVARILGNDMNPKVVVDYIRNFNSDTTQSKNLDTSELEDLMKVFSFDELERKKDEEGMD
ncbi:MAG TPA: DUF4252 domain-containing protein [Flavobacteriaceae bacterium]|nr:DUF4252 domain-containing protein [Flavobacteriaceae bacterium]